MNLKLVATIAQAAMGAAAFAFTARAARKNQTIKNITDAVMAAFTKLPTDKVNTPTKEAVEDTISQVATVASQAFRLVKGKRHNFFYSLLQAVASGNELKNQVVPDNGQPKSHVQTVMDAVLKQIPKAGPVTKPSDIVFAHWNNVSAIVDSIMGTRGTVVAAKLGMIVPEFIQKSPAISLMTMASTKMSNKWVRNTFETLCNPYKEYYFGPQSNNFEKTRRYNLYREKLKAAYKKAKNTDLNEALRLKKIWDAWTVIELNGA
jgi:hypothetical protein